MLILNYLIYYIYIMNTYYTFVISLLVILLIHYLIVSQILNNNISVKGLETFNNEKDMETELLSFIKNKSNCNDEYNPNVNNDYKIYQLDNIEDKQKPYNEFSKNNTSRFCSDKNQKDVYFNKNKDKLNKFLNKFNYNKCVEDPKIDVQTYAPIYEKNETITKEQKQYGNDKILNGGNFFNDITGFTENDLSENYAAF